MAGIKCKYYLIMCETTYKITKHISVFKIKWGKVFCIVLRNTSYNTNHFLAIPEAKAILEPAKKIDYKNLYLDNFNRKYLRDNYKDTKMLVIKHITPISVYFISKYTIFTQFSSDI